MEKLVVKNLTCGYSSSSWVIRGVSFTALGGRLTFIIGRIGSGKTTLLRGIAGLARCRGSVELNGVNLLSLGSRERARLVAYVPQFMAAAELTVFETVVTSRYPYSLLGLGKEDSRAVRNALEMLGLWELRDRKLSELSGGQLRKVAIAAALARKTRILLLDEPTANLDVASAVEVMETVRRLAQRDSIVVLVATHDLVLTSMYADTVVVLKNGTIVEQGPPERVLDEKTVEQAYGVRVKVGVLDGVKCVVPLSG